MENVETTATKVTVHSTNGSHNTPPHRTTLNIAYLLSGPGVPKILEFFTLVVSFSCLANCCSIVRHPGFGDYSVYYDVFIGSTVLAWILVIIIFLLYLFHVVSRISIPMSLLILALNLLFGIVIFVAAALIAKFADDFNVQKIHRIYDEVVAAVVLGFVSSLLLFIDAFIHFKIFRGATGQR